MEALFPFFIQSSGKKRRSVATHALPIAFQEEHGEDSSLLRSLPEEFGVSAMEPKVLVLISEAGTIVTIMRAAHNLATVRSKTFWSHSH